jgi:phage-related holin
LKIIKDDKHLASVILAMQKDLIVNLKTLIQFCNFCKFYTNFYISEFHISIISSRNDIFIN